MEINTDHNNLLKQQKATIGKMTTIFQVSDELDNNY